MMMQKWAVVQNGAPLQCLSCETPMPKGREILIEVTHCGVCHSDLHFQKGFFDLGGGKVLRITDRGVTLPCAPGHEIAGRVAALGPDAQGVAIGDSFVVYPWIGCGVCELCRTDRENLCYTPKSLGTFVMAASPRTSLSPALIICSRMKASMRPSLPRWPVPPHRALGHS